MKILFSDIEILGFGRGYVGVDGERICYLSVDEPLDRAEYDRVICGKERLLMPGLYNCHTHLAMTLFRGYGEDLPLQAWLNDRIFPAEDKLTDRAVYVASKLAMAEMIRCGTVSCSDMYFFCDQTVKAAAEMGMKANISRSVVTFDPDVELYSDYRFLEGKKLWEDYHNCEGGRIKIDMALHAEYTNVEKAVRQMADFSREHGIINQIHLSETEKEHAECIARHGKTPTAFFADCGLFDTPTLTAHSVYATDEDMDIMREKGVIPVYNPVSNLKLGSGVFPLQKALDKGLQVTLGTDGAASNNTLDLFKDLHVGTILQKGISRHPDQIKAAETVKIATENGAKAQGRADCGRIEVGCKADLVMLDLDAVNNIPMYDPYHTVVYSANSSNVLMTVCDGRILYENGAYTTVDIEALKYDMKDVCAHYFD